MPTERPRVTFAINPDQLKKLEEYRFNNRIKNQTQAILSLIDKGLSDLEGDSKKAPSISDGAMKLAENYDHKLDNWGRQAIRDLMDTEMARVADEARFRDTIEDKESKVIPLYLYPSAAGYATPVMNEDYENYELGPDDPPAAEFAVRLQGDSMEPDFPDGSIVFANRDSLRDGEIGIFSVDGGTVCKQYHKEGGVVYLFSLNRRRSDADVVLLPSSNRSFVFQGRVITRKRYPVPGRG